MHDWIVPDWIVPDWAAPAAVRALCTTRSGGSSRGPWASMNLGRRCGDDPTAVRENRRRLNAVLPAAPQWLRQVHGSEVAVHPGTVQGELEADALIARGPARVCAVLTADCLPVVFCSRAGDEVAVAHAGWRGLAAGVLERTVHALNAAPAELLAWLGPAIGPAAYEVGPDVVAAFAAEFPAGFRPHGERWLLDLYALARLRLARAGVTDVSGGDFCTFSDPARFYSCRRDAITGRMASLVWIDSGSAG